VTVYQFISLVNPSGCGKALFRRLMPSKNLRHSRLLFVSCIHFRRAPVTGRSRKYLWPHIMPCPHPVYWEMVFCRFLSVFSRILALPRHLYIPAPRFYTIERVCYILVWGAEGSAPALNMARYSSPVGFVGSQRDRISVQAEP
jgi:hypothetical protein